MNAGSWKGLELPLVTTVCRKSKVFLYTWFESVPQSSRRFFLFFLKCIYLFLAVLGLRCCAWASHCGGFSCCRARGLGVRASVVVARELSSCGTQALERRLSSCGARA